LRGHQLGQGRGREGAFHDRSHSRWQLGRIRFKIWCKAVSGDVTARSLPVHDAHPELFPSRVRMVHGPRQ
jgi:hypothetical protein